MDATACPLQEIRKSERWCIIATLQRAHESTLGQAEEATLRGPRGNVMTRNT